jgi:WD40 repeat protein
VGDDTYLATAGEDATVCVSRLLAEDDDPPAVIAGFNGPVRVMCAFTAGEQTCLAMVTTGITIWQWRAQTDHSVVFPAWVTVVHPLVLGDQTLLIVGGGDGSIRIWDPLSGGPDPGNPEPSNGVDGIAAFTLSDRTLVAAQASGYSTQIWDVSTGDLLSTLADHDPAGGMCAFSLGSRTLLATSWDATVRTWDPSTGGLTHTFTLPERVSGICPVRLGADQLLAAA